MQVISKRREYDRIVAIVDRLAVKRDPSLEEERLLELLSTLVEVCENEHCPIPDAPPHVMIQQFMLDRGLRQADLVPVLGSRSLVSEVVNGKRKPSKLQVKNLGEFFGVSPQLFLSLD
ncbi:MAG: helix-turn-helix domain-containing protein [Acidobacteriota bacterium]